MDIEILRSLLGVVGVFVIASFMPWTAYSFFTFRLDLKKKEYRAMLLHLGYSEERGPAYLPSLEVEYKPFDYLLPVAFATLITTLCSIVLIYGSKIVGEPQISLILNGPYIAYDETLEENVRNRLFGMLIIAFSFMGAYIWSIQALFRRLATVDLTPGAFYSVGIRIIFSVFIALLLYYWLTDGNVKSIIENKNPLNTPSTLALYAFFAGMFPQRVLQYLSDKVMFMNSVDSKKSDPLPLQMIEGITLFERTRFVEVGITNAQNLAKSNFIELIIRTPFNPREIIDWIGQARLYLYFKDDISKLRKAGVRTVFNLKTLGQVPENLKVIADLTEGVSIEKLKLVFELVNQDKDIKELGDALEKLVLTQDSISKKSGEKKRASGQI